MEIDEDKMHRAVSQKAAEDLFGEELWNPWSKKGMPSKSENYLQVLMQLKNKHCALSVYY